MKIYVYNNLKIDTEQIRGAISDYGIYNGKKIEKIFDEKPDSARNAISELNRIVKNGDVVITSSLINLSLDFVTALQHINNFLNKGVTLVAVKENFNSSEETVKILVSYLPLMHDFRTTAFNSSKQKRLDGIKKAVAEGKYGRQPYSPNDFSNFRELYNDYMSREIGKSEFAEKLGVSRPTLDKLLNDFTKRR